MEYLALAENNHQPKIAYLVKLTLKCEEEIKTFSNKN
jgi:hypothetical protein